MPELPRLARIAVYPIKSLDPAVVDSSRLVEQGALAVDREYAIFNQRGQWIRAKSHAQMHRLRTTYSHHFKHVEIQIQGTDERFRFALSDHNAALNDFLSGFLDEPVTVRRNRHGGFPDEMNNRPGPTIISRATLEAVASWFPGKTLEDMRLRFRANLEVEGVPAFWEDTLIGPLDKQPRLRIGEATFYGFHPCARCAVVTRDPHTGQSERNFQKAFMAMRQQTQPLDSKPQVFDHFFRLAINTHVDESAWDSTLEVGDAVAIEQPAER